MKSLRIAAGTENSSPIPGNAADDFAAPSRDRVGAFDVVDRVAWAFRRCLQSPLPQPRQVPENVRDQIGTIPLSIPAIEGVSRAIGNPSAFMSCFPLQPSYSSRTFST